MKKIISIIFLILCAGCNVAPDGVASIYVSDGQGSGELKLIVMPDGTKCAVLIGYYKAAISCDWSQK